MFLLVPAHPGSPGQRGRKMVVAVVYCEGCVFMLLHAVKSSLISRMIKAWNLNS